MPGDEERVKFPCSGLLGRREEEKKIHEPGVIHAAPYQPHPGSGSPRQPRRSGLRKLAVSVARTHPLPRRTLPGRACTSRPRRFFPSFNTLPAESGADRHGMALAWLAGPPPSLSLRPKPCSPAARLRAPCPVPAPCQPWPSPASRGWTNAGLDPHSSFTSIPGDASRTPTPGRMTNKG